MSVKIMALVWESDLPRDEKTVALSYADHADHDGRNIFPSVGRTAWKTGYSERSVQAITKKLVERGVLIPEGNGPYGTNRYYMELSALPRRPSYEGGEKTAPPQELHPGGEKTAPHGVQPATSGGEESAPNPSMTHPKKHEVNHQKVATQPKDQPHPQETTAPDTPEARKLFARLEANAKARSPKYRGPTRFKSLEQKRMFLEAVEVLGDRFDYALQKAMEQGRTNITSAINYLASPNWKKPQHRHTYGNRRPKADAAILEFCERHGIEVPHGNT